MNKAFYRREGEDFVPTGLGISVWNPNAQLGVAMAGLIGQTLDDQPTLSPMITARMTMDILGAVPIRPLRTRVRVLRDGKRMQTLEIDLAAGDQTYVRCTALRVREGDTPESPAPLPPYPMPGEGKPIRSGTWHDSIRLVGDHRVPGPGATWIKFTAEVIEGVAPSPMARMAMIADYAAGTAPLLPLSEWTLANLDLAIYMARPPVGDWLLVDATSQGSGTGIGLGQGRIGDTAGMFGTSLQTVFLDRRLPQDTTRP